MGLEDLRSALQNMAVVFAGDKSLLQSIAHGHDVVQAPITQPPERVGAYELRLPSGNEEDLQAFLAARVVNVLCPDRRQAAQVAEELDGQNTVWISPAGGAAQPHNDRLAALATVLVEAMEANKRLIVNLCVHTGICGGVKHAMGEGFFDLMYRNIPDQDGHDGGWERKMMVDIAGYLTTELAMSGVDMARVFGYLAHVNPDDEFAGISPFGI